MSNGNEAITRNDLEAILNEVLPSDTGDDVTGVKGNAETDYRTGNVNLTPANIGALARADFVIELHSATTGNVNTNTDSGDKTATFTKAGYYPYGIVGINMGGTNRMYQNIYEYRLSSRSSGSCTMTYRFRNNSSSTFSGTLYVDVLWIKI